MTSDQHRSPFPPAATTTTGLRGARVTRVINLPVDRAWHLLSDARNHEPWIPLTTITADEPGRGALITAISGPRGRDGRRHGLVDLMRIDVYAPPGNAGMIDEDDGSGTVDASGLRGSAGAATFTKLGPLLLGNATITVVDDSVGRSRVTWEETVWLARFPRRLTAAVAAPLLHLMITRVLGKVARVQ